MNTFPKSEKLCGEIQINQLFNEGKAFISYPLRIVYMIETALPEKQNAISAVPGVKVMVSVPKKKIRKAHDRNRIKRLVREAYRLNKSDFTSYFTEKSLSLQLAMTYVSDQRTDFNTVQIKVKEAMDKIIKKMNKDNLNFENPFTDQNQG